MPLYKGVRNPTFHIEAVQVTERTVVRRKQMPWNKNSVEEVELVAEPGDWVLGAPPDQWVVRKDLFPKLYLPVEEGE